MAVEALEFTKPGGLLNTKALWPRISAGELKKKFEAWLEDAAARVEAFTEDTQDDATRAWVRYRAWDDVLQVRLGNPTSLAVEGRGSHGYTQGQIDAATAERDAALAEFQAIAAELLGDDVAPLAPRGSQSVPIQFVF